MFEYMLWMCLEDWNEDQEEENEDRENIEE